jgi:hypothetical protein
MHRKTKKYPGRVNENGVFTKNCKSKNNKNGKKNQCSYIDSTILRKKSLDSAISILQRWLPNGQLIGHEYKALNPKRSDTRIGSFSINIRTGQWADFATGDKGGDLISLAAYLFNLSWKEAAKKVAVMLGVEVQQ